MDISGIRIISDSLTVLNYLRGIFQIRNIEMMNIIEDTLWNLHLVEETLSLPIILQWTKSHSNNFGNDHADYLANLGSNAANTLPFGKVCEDPWKNISLRAVNTRNSRPFTTDYRYRFQAHISTSSFGRTYQHISCYSSSYPSWTKTSIKELSLHSRDSSRILLGIRTGHNHLRKYLHCQLRRYTSSRCPCGHGPQTIHHLLVSCTNPEVVVCRRHMLKVYRHLHHQWLFSLSDEDRFRLDPPDWSSFDLTQEIYFSDPPTFYPPETRCQIQRLIIYLYRIGLGYSKYTKFLRFSWLLLLMAHPITCTWNPIASWGFADPHWGGASVILCFDQCTSSHVLSAPTFVVCVILFLVSLYLFFYLDFRGVLFDMWLFMGSKQHFIHSPYLLLRSRLGTDAWSILLWLGWYIRFD